MVTKIYDILPPEEKRGIKKPKKNRKKKKKFYFSLIIAILFGFFLSYSYLFTFAKIYVYPHFEAENLETEVMLKEGQKEIDFEKGIIPASLFSEESTLFEEFSSTGKIIKEGKAKGVIRVFNEYSTSSIAFRAGTRFMSASGKIFISPKRIVIPGKKLKKGKWVAGFRDVEVEAIEAGKEYNIEPTTFSIPGLSGTALYPFFYGKSFERMKGGFKREIKVVTKEDIERAERILFEKIKEIQIKKLKEKGEEIRAILFEKTLDQEILSFEPLAKEGDEVEKFGGRMKMRSIIFFCKKKTLEDFAIRVAKFLTPKEKMLLEKSLKIDWKIKEINLEKREIKLNLEISFKTFKKIDLQEIKNKITRKNRKEIERIFGSCEEISKFEIKVTPFWMKNFIPKDKNRIKIQLVLD